MKNIGSIHATKDILAEEGFRIKKHFGQNFLVDKNILQKIVKDSGITNGTDVIEIGPGFGALTEVLLSFSQRVLAYEIDKDLIPILKNNFADAKNLTLIHKDILEVNIDQEIDQYLPGAKEVVVLANLPYYITTPILMRFLETSKKVSKLVIMMQKEVADRVTSRPDTKDYNALSVVINYRAETKILFTVPRSVFIPAPNVDSAVVMVRVRDEIECRPADEDLFFEFVHNCFTQRRKTLMNNLRQAYPSWNKTELEQMLANNGLPIAVRAEALGIADFIRLSNEVMAKK